MCRIAIGIVGLFLIFFQSLLGQKSLETGLFFGLGLYQGDLTEDIVQYDDSRMAKGLFLRYNHAPHVSMRLGYMHGTLSATDMNSRTRQDRGWTFEGTIHEVYVASEIYLENQFKRATNGAPMSFFNPYIYLGGGFARVLGTKSTNSSTSDQIPDETGSNDFFVLPLGAGIRGELSPWLRLGIEYSFRATFSDKLDQVVTATNRNDWYSYVGLNASVSIFKEKYKTYRKRAYQRSLF